MTTIDMNELAAVAGGIKWGEAHQLGWEMAKTGAKVGAAAYGIAGFAFGGPVGAIVPAVVGGAAIGAASYAMGAGAGIYSTWNK